MGSQIFFCILFCLKGRAREEQAETRKDLLSTSSFSRCPQQPRLGPDEGESQELCLPRRWQGPFNLSHQLVASRMCTGREMELGTV